MTDTATTAAATIYAQMNDDQRASYDRDAWREGVSLMLDGEWAHLTEDDVLDALDGMIGATLYDYRTGEELRPATPEEYAASIAAGPEGAIDVDGRVCYVQ